MTLSCFRYPGSKAKLLPVLMNYIDPLLKSQTHFIDLFVGGGSVLLEVAKKYPTIQLFANDKNYYMASFWSIVAGDDSKKLDALLAMVAVKPTLEQFYKLRETTSTDDVECAYRAIFFNRTTFSGILDSGPIGGKDQKSKYTIDCRYNAKKLQDKILNCHKLLSGRTKVYNVDFSECDEFINTDYPVYLDPPYIGAGPFLYSIYMNELEHIQLAELLKVRKNFILSYDDNRLIRQLYSNCEIIDAAVQYSINGKKINWKHNNEIIITHK